MKSRNTTETLFIVLLIRRNMLDKLTNEVVVDLIKNNEFSQAHLELTENIYNSHWKQFYPELFGDKLPEAIEFVGFELRPNDGSTGIGIQKNRVGAKNVKFLEIKQNVERNGYKLKYTPISIFDWSNNVDGSIIITGDTRIQVISDPPFEMNNFICAVYKAKPGYTKEQIQDAIDCCGLRFNAIHDPAAPLSTQDVKRTVSNAVQRYLDTDGEAGIPKTMDAIEDRVDYVCGEGVFQPMTRQNLIYEIYNNFNPHDIVVSWSNSKSAKWRIDTFMQKSKFVDTDTVKYMYTSFELYSKAFTKACRLANEYPKAEIRIIIQTATLKGYDLSRTFKSRIQKFVNAFGKIVLDVCGASDKSTTFSRIKIYGALPSLGAIHDLEVPIFYNKRTDTFYQKTNDFTFDAVEQDEAEEVDYEEAA